MDLAIKWLVTLVVFMWVVLCSFDHFKKNKEILSAPNTTKVTHNTKPILSHKEEFRPKGHRRQSIAVFNYAAFFAGALVVTLFNKKKEIISFAKEKFKYVRAKLSEIDLREHGISVKDFVSDVTIFIRKTFQEKHPTFRKFFQAVCVNLPSFGQAKPRNRSFINTLILQRLQKLQEERNNIGTLLITALQENKNIRMQYQLENLAKNRLASQLQAIQTQINENRAKFVYFKQQCLVSQQENMYLRSRVEKLKEEKETAENNLAALMDQVNMYGDHYLRSFCAGILRNSDLPKPDELAATSKTGFMIPVASTSNWMASANCCAFVPLSKAKSVPSTMNVLDRDKDNGNICFFKTERVREHRDVNGECVWTVKDKDGMIEKLYECDGVDFDNGETVRRIREYSVFHDKDCILDFANSRSTTIIRTGSSADARHCQGIQMPTKNFLTGSPVFQQFLESNKNLCITKSASTHLPLLTVCR